MYRPGADLNSIPADYVLVEERGRYVAYGCRPGLRDYVGGDLDSMINNVLSSLRSGGKVVLKPGTYEVGPIEVTSNYRLVIQGSGLQTRLVAKDPSRPLILVDGQDPVRRTADNITIAGMRLSGATGDNPGHNAVELRNTANVTLLDLLVEGFYNGLYTREATRVHGQRLWFYNPYNWGVLVDTGVTLADQLWLDDVQVTDSPTGGGILVRDFDSYRISRAYMTMVNDAIRVERTANGVKDCIGWITDVDLDLYRGSGVILVGARKVEVKGAWCVGGTYGLNAGDCQYLKVIGGWFAANREHGVLLNGCDRVTITGCLVYNNGAAYPNQRDGIMIYNSTRVVVSGVVAFDDQATKTQRYGVNEEGASDYNVVANCILSGNATGGVNLVGLNSLQANNIQ